MNGDAHLITCHKLIKLISFVVCISSIMQFVRNDNTLLYSPANLYSPFTHKFAYSLAQFQQENKQNTLLKKNNKNVNNNTKYEANS